MKKIIKTLGLGWILLIFIVIAAIIIVATLGFKVGLKYSENTQISVNIGSEFNVDDIKQITDEVFPKQSVIIQQVEVYKDMVQITVNDVSDDQLSDLNSKINDKFGTDNEVSDITVSKYANTRLKDLVRPYILPFAITFVILLCYAMIRFRKLGIGKVAYGTITTIIVPQILLFSAYAICRIPINRVTIVLSFVFYIFSSFAVAPKFLRSDN